MNKTNQLGRAALVTAIALCFAAPTFAQTTGTTNAKPGATAAPATTPAPAMAPAPATATDPWASKYATEHQGRISKQAYLDEMGRRFETMDKAKRGDLTRQAYLDDLARQWEALDRTNQGLAPNDLSKITSKVPAFTDPAPAGKMEEPKKATK